MPRHELADGVFHVTGRGAGGIDIFRDDIDRIEFVRLLVRQLRRWRWECHAWCLMTTHYHAILESPVERLSRGMHQLNGRYAYRFNSRHLRFGHLFEERFSALPIEDDDYLEAACEYVLANPVRAGVTCEVGEWPWAGYGTPAAVR